MNLGDAGTQNTNASYGDYARQLEAIAPGLTGQVEANRASGESWVDSLARLLPILATTYQQRQLLSVQVERARAGLAPLDVSAYTPGFNVGLSADTKQLLIYGGIAAIAVYAVTQFARR